MQLAKALGLSNNELVSFVGAGGKKTAMSRLVSEGQSRLSEERSRVSEGQSRNVVGYTTSTKMPPPSDLPLVCVDDTPDLVERTDLPPSVALARDYVSDPERVDEKVRGFAPERLNSMFEEGQFQWLLVKADGARMRGFKAPGPNEPQIPTASSIVVPVASVQVVGKPLTTDVAHRLNRIEQLTGTAPGERITAETVGSVLAHPEGGLKHVPDTATVLPLVNKADTATQEAVAADILSHAIARSPRLDRGLVCSFEADRLTVVS